MAGGAAADGGDSVDGVSVRARRGPSAAPYPCFSFPPPKPPSFLYLRSTTLTLQVDFLWLLSKALEFGSDSL